MESAVQRFERILDENNLTVSLQTPKVKSINGGGLIIDEAMVQVVFTDPSLEQPKTEEVKDVSAEQGTEEVAQEAPAI